MKESVVINLKRRCVQNVAVGVLLGVGLSGIGCQKSGDAFADEINRERGKTSSTAASTPSVDPNAPMGGQPPKAGNSDYAPASPISAPR